MAIVNSNVVAGSSGTLTISTLNNLILLVVVRNGSSTQFVSSIAGPVGSWTSALGTLGFATEEQHPGAFYVSYFFGYANATGAQTITPTFNGSAPGTIHLYMAECSNLDAVTPFIAAISNQQTSLAPAANAVTVASGSGGGSDNVTAQPALIISGGETTAGTLAAGAGFTQNFVGAARLIQSTQVNATGVFDSTATLNTSAGTVTFFQIALKVSGSTYTFVHDSAACSTTAVATLSTPAVNVTAGNFLFAAAMGNGQTITSVTDGPGDTFTSQGNTGAGKLQVFVCPSALGGSTSVTFNIGGSTNYQVYMAEFSGLANALGSIIGTSNTNSKSGTAVTGGAINFTTVPALLWSMCVDASSDVTAPICTGSMITRATALWACNSPFQLNAVGDQLVSISGNASSTFQNGNQFDAMHVFSVAVPLFSSGPSSPPLTQLMNRRNQLYFV